MQRRSKQSSTRSSRSEDGAGNAMTATPEGDQEACQMLMCRIVLGIRIDPSFEEQFDHACLKEHKLQMV